MSQTPKEAVNHAADLIEARVSLDEQDRDLLNLLVNITVYLAENPQARPTAPGTLDAAIRAMYDGTGQDEDTDVVEQVLSWV